MKSNYKRLGEYIREVNVRNLELKDVKLLGVSIQKVFIPSIANTIGTNMKTYKLIKKDQFAYGPVTSRNGDKISIALLENYKEAMISQSYTCFEIINKNELLPEYLMMWFRRPEFDRYARYMSHGSVREIFSWEEMCDVELPIPSIQEQRKIVKEYNVLVNRNCLSNNLIGKLAETAQSIYKQWFIDFEFPDENGKPYKSNGGEMEYNKKLDMDIPKGWDVMKVGELCESNPSNLSKNDSFKTISYLDTSNITNNEIDEIKILNLEKDKIPSRAKRKVIHNDIVFSTVRPNLKHFGIIKNPEANLIASTGFVVLRPIHPNICSELIYLTITSDDTLKKLQAKAEMSVSTYPSIRPEDLLNIDFIMPPVSILEKAESIFVPVYNLIHLIQKEKKILGLGMDILLSRLATTKEVFK